jgi:hypothetical protein
MELNQTFTSLASAEYSCFAKLSSRWRIAFSLDGSKLKSTFDSGFQFEVDTANNARAKAATHAIDFLCSRLRSSAVPAAAAVQTQCCPVCLLDRSELSIAGLFWAECRARLDVSIKLTGAKIAAVLNFQKD